ncbi:Iron-containing redox enzyme [Lentzea albidocapillata subsp. violacea]|uniref:Iron-containing redox enzyme n=1 Tax=Lentzea albidocapillata subsp. violacea TaxID=128104 RepID=A0A1G9EGB5_9PSEU|nr:iron-containing redox enzyme family protein [Lentzea albidocapillata]SDK75075.1 Iron-containing redox enzyme [Lentzea albidocapillata subsp. violacea]
MRLPGPRGHMSSALVSALRLPPPPQPALLVSGGTREAWQDDDLQLSLWICYELRMRGFDDVATGWEDHPALAQFHAALETRWETALRSLTEVTSPVALSDEGLSELRGHHAFWQPRREMRSVLRDIQGDAYGTRSERTHSVLFTVTLRDLDPFSGVDEMPAPTLALANALSLFGLHRRLVGALVGFLTAVDTIGGDPFAQLLPVQCPPEDVRLGFTACHELHARLTQHVHASLQAGRTSLRCRRPPVSSRVNVGC